MGSFPETLIDPSFQPKIQVPSRSKWEDIEPAEDKLSK